MTMPAAASARGSRVTKLPNGDLQRWYSRAVWGTIVSIGTNCPAITVETENNNRLSFVIEGAPKVGNRLLIRDSWFTEERAGCYDQVSVEFKAHGLHHEFLIAPAHDWLVDNFPQDPIMLDDKPFIILSEDDLTIAELANPGAKQISVEDAAAVYCPYIPLIKTGAQAANPAAPSIASQINHAQIPSITIYKDPHDIDPKVSFVTRYKGVSSI